MELLFMFLLVHGPKFRHTNLRSLSIVADSSIKGIVARDSLVFLAELAKVWPGEELLMVFFIFY
jgi:hypothetical protein